MLNILIIGNLNQIPTGNISITHNINGDSLHLEKKFFHFFYFEDSILVVYITRSLIL